MSAYTLSTRSRWGGKIVIDVPRHMSACEHRLLRAAFDLAVECSATVLTEREAANAIGFVWASGPSIDAMVLLGWEPAASDPPCSLCAGYGLVGGGYAERPWDGPSDPDTQCQLCADEEPTP